MRPSCVRPQSREPPVRDRSTIRSTRHLGGCRPSARDETWPRFHGQPMASLAQLDLTQSPFVPPLLAEFKFIAIWIAEEDGDFLAPGKLDRPKGEAWELRAYRSVSELVRVDGLVLDHVRPCISVATYWMAGSSGRRKRRSCSRFRRDLRKGRRGRRLSLADASWNARRAVHRPTSRQGVIRTASRAERPTQRASSDWWIAGRSTRRAPRQPSDLPLAWRANRLCDRPPIEGARTPRAAQTQCAAADPRVDHSRSDSRSVGPRTATPANRHLGGMVERGRGRTKSRSE